MSIKVLGVSCALVLALLAATAFVVLERSGAAPRQLAKYIERRAIGHNELIVRATQFAASTLRLLDRTTGQSALAPGLPVVPFAPAAAPSGAPGVPARPGTERIVTSAGEAAERIARASEGDVIIFAPGTYHFSKRPYIASSLAPNVTVMALEPDTVFLEFAMSEGFLVRAPGWRFENLHIRGVCEHHWSCEHAFHIIGGASNFVARNNVMLDFNAHLKINGSGGQFPDHGRVEGNTLKNLSVRQTSQSVTPIDLVGASGWVFRANLVADFVKGKGDRISYGAFAKGAGEANRFEGNIIICESALRGAAGQRVGLSLGGGGTGAAYCRDKRCISEQFGGVIASNLIAACSDEGIYLNRASASKVVHNTLIDTAGIMVRFPESSADLEGNLLDGRIRGSNGAIVRSIDNLESGFIASYAGWHPSRRFFIDVEHVDLRWQDDAPRRESGAPGATDLCGAVRPALPRYGAFEEFGRCLGR